jgi:hypothetical protein
MISQLMDVSMQMVLGLSLLNLMQLNVQDMEELLVVILLCQKI